jgi:SAM-dependent methyltransferase
MGRQRGLDADLVSYYDQEARDGSRTSHGPIRTQLLAEFIDLLKAEGRRSVVDVGSGPGLDTAGFADAGFEVVGADLSVENARIMHARGLHAGLAASLYELPFPSARFDALWTMSTFVHVPHERFGQAMAELLRVVRPGASVGVGTWGGFEWEGVSDRDTIVPRRFFSLAAHDRWRAMLESVGTVERFEVFQPDPASNWEYQFAIVRA